MEDVDAASSIVQRRAETSPETTLAVLNEMHKEADKAKKKKAKKEKKDAATGDEDKDKVAADEAALREKARSGPGRALPLRPSHAAVAGAGRAAAAPPRTPRRRRRRVSWWACAGHGGSGAKFGRGPWGWMGAQALKSLQAKNAGMAAAAMEEDGAEERSP
jgi:hypothetical protein